MRTLVAVLLLAPAAFAQQASQTAAPPAPPMSDDEVAAVFNRISQRAARLDPMIAQLHPADWVAKGAPDTYVDQWNSVKQQFAAVRNDLSDLLQRPNHGADHLSDSLKALFRIQAANLALGSLLGGVRKYQNPALADLIESVAAEAGGDVEKFEEHLVELADAKEQQFALVDHEAQRCRATLSRQPAAPATGRKP